MGYRNQPEPGYCKKFVHDGGRSVSYHCCRFRAKRDGYCNIHHPDAVAERDKIAHEKYEEKRKNSLLERHKALQKKYRDLLATTRKVADSAEKFDHDDVNSEYTVLGHYMRELRTLVDKS